jgi:hypothetical protein
MHLRETAQPSALAIASVSHSICIGYERGSTHGTTLGRSPGNCVALLPLSPPVLAQFRTRLVRALVHHDLTQPVEAAQRSPRLTAMRLPR